MTTIEPCPTCRTIASCDHLGDIHIWDCPNCGEIIATVMYETPDCAVGQATEQTASKGNRDDTKPD
jgi:ribosomal protein L37AE/L43A